MIQLYKHQAMAVGGPKHGKTVDIQGLLFFGVWIHHRKNDTQYTPSRVKYRSHAVRFTAYLWLHNDLKDQDGAVIAQVALIQFLAQASGEE